MKKETRLKNIQRLAKTDLGDALVDFLEEKVIELKDGKNFDPKDFEMDGKSSLKAAEKLAEMINLLKQLRQKPEEVKKTSYR